MNVPGSANAVSHAVPQQGEIRHAWIPVEFDVRQPAQAHVIGHRKGRPEFVAALPQALS